MFIEANPNPCNQRVGDTVLDHIKDNKQVIGNYGESEFLQAVCSKDEQEVFWLLDELLAITKDISPKLYNSFIAKVEGII